MNNPAKTAAVRFCLGLLAGLCLLMAGCTKTIYSLSAGTYAAKKTEDVAVQPTITFDLEKNTFHLVCDPLFSEGIDGEISIGGGIVTAKTDDGETYRFQIIDNDTICFIQKGSSPITAADGSPSVKNGTEFYFEAMN